MKKLIKQAMLRYGGYTGARKINAQIEYYSLVKRYLEFIKTGQASLPDKIMFEPTQRCNLQCKMCFQDRRMMVQHKELSSGQIANFFNESPFLKKVTLIGGEVFMRNDLADIIEHLNTNRDIVICTNGTLLDDAGITMLGKCDRVYTVCISLDGPRDIHDSIRQVKGSYDKAIRTIQALVSIVPVTVNLVIQDENFHFIPDIIDLCASMGVKKVKIEIERIYSRERHKRAIAETGLIPSDIPIASKDRVRSYSLEALQNILLECLERGSRLGIDVFIDPPYLMNNLQACYESTLLTAEIFICHMINTATVSPNGDVINCIHIRKPFGNILEAPFEEIWNSADANAFRRRLLKNNLTSVCENCPFMSPAPQSIVRKIKSLKYPEINHKG